MISEVTPRGKEFLFFSLFSIIGKTSSFIGPPSQQRHHRRHGKQLFTLLLFVCVEFG